MPSVIVNFQTLSEKYRLDDCIKCKRCTKNCPSAKHGGIIPDRVVSEVSEGIYDGNPWTCLMCHRCGMVCPKDIDIPELIRELRQSEASKENIPDRFSRVYKRYMETGDTLSVAASMDEERNRLGLPNMERDVDALEKLRKITGGKE